MCVYEGEREKGGWIGTADWRFLAQEKHSARGQVESESVGCSESCTTVCSPTDCSPVGFSVHEILQARILEWVAISYSRGSSQPKDWTQVSCIAGRFFIDWATREAPWTHGLLSIFNMILRTLMALFHLGYKKMRLTERGMLWSSTYHWMISESQELVV